MNEIIETVDRWDDSVGSSYITMEFESGDFCTTKTFYGADNETHTYVKQGENGFEVSREPDGECYRNLTEEEKAEVYAWVEERFRVEDMLDGIQR